MKMKITDLMDLYEDRNCPLVPIGESEEENRGAHCAPLQKDREEAIEVKQRKHRFGWKEALSLAAALALVALGGFGVRRLMDRGHKPIYADDPTTRDIAALSTEQHSTEPQTTASPEPTYSVNPFEVNDLLTAFAEQGITDSAAELAGEYELAQFAHIYTKLHHWGAIEYQTVEGESWETLTLWQVNETLSALLGRTLSPVEGTDYTIQRGDNYAQHESFHDGCFWWPAADGDTHTRFAIYNDRTQALAGHGTETLEVLLLEVDPARWPEWVNAGLPDIGMEELDRLLAAERVRLVGKGQATVEWSGPKPRLQSFRVELAPEDDAALREELTGLFADPQSWYSRALTSRFAYPEDVDLYELFYLGIPGVEYALTQEEAAALAAQGVSTEPDVDRLPKGVMSEVLLQLFGLPLEDFTGYGLEKYATIPDSDCYFHCHGDTNAMPVSVTGIWAQADGTVLVRYIRGGQVNLGTVDSRPWTAVLFRYGDGGWQIRSNLPGEWTTAEDAGALAYLYKAPGVYRTETQDLQGVRTLRELSLEANGSMRYREGDPNSEFSHWENGEWRIVDDHTLELVHHPVDETGHSRGSSAVSVYRCELLDDVLVLTQQSEAGLAEDGPGTELRFPLPVQ